MTFEITKLDYEGRGIAYQNGKVCFIKHALPQEVVNGTLLKEAKKYAIYEAKEIIKPSSIRTESFCPFATKCGGCVFSHVSYENSLKLKEPEIQEPTNPDDPTLPEGTKPGNPNNQNNQTGNSTKQQPSKTTAVKTGDDLSVWGLSTMMIMALGSMLVIKKKR